MQESRNRRTLFSPFDQGLEGSVCKKGNQFGEEDKLLVSFRGIGGIGCLLVVPEELGRRQDLEGAVEDLGREVGD